MYDKQGAGSCAEQLHLADQLFGAALGEFSVVANGQPRLIVGDLNVEPTKTPSLPYGISAGLWVDLQACWAAADGAEAGGGWACKRTLAYRKSWGFPGWMLTLRGCSAGVKLWLIGGFSLILLCDLGLMLISGPAVLVSVHKLPLSGLLLGCLRLTNKSRESNSAELRRTGLLHDERLGFIGAVMLVLWMMLWLVVMSQPLGKSGLRRLTLHLRMLTRFAGGPVAECGVELGRGLPGFVLFDLAVPTCAVPERCVLIQRMVDTSC